MKKEVIFEIAQRKLVDLRQIDGSNILRGKYQINGSVAAIYYLDYSESMIAIDQIQDFQEKYISSDYYNNPGFLQWNYYLLFIRDSFDEQIKKEIEQNDIYSRKFILSPNEFESFFKHERFQGVVQQDIVIKWKEMLRSVNLHEVMSRNTPYSTAIERFINGEATNDLGSFPDRQTNPSSDQITKQHINQLELKGYRPFPIKRVFEFSSVNLIHGVNGTGKTSLLEAIELVLCGRSSRYGQPKEKEGSIAIGFKGGFVDTFTPRDNTKYQLRDSNWYNNVYKQRNYLTDSFNRYNYFNAEAAYKLNTEKLSDYRKLLEAIALGKEFSFLSERLEGFRSRLRDVDSNLTKTSIELKTKIAEAIKQRALANEAKNLLGLEGKLREFLKSMQWNEDEINGFAVDGSSFETSMSRVQTLLNKLNRTESVLRISNFSDLVSLNDEIHKSIDKAASLIRLLKENESTKVITEKEMEGLEFIASLFSNIARYYTERESFRLIGLNSRIQQMQKSLEKSNKLADQSDLIEWTSIPEHKIKFENLETQSRQAIKSLTAEQQTLSRQLSSMKDGLNQLNKIESEIKALGRDFIIKNPTAHECPLCSAPYPYQELSRRIHEVKFGIENNSGITLAEDRLNDINTQVTFYKDQLTHLSAIGEIAHIAYNDSRYRQENIESIKSAIQISINSAFQLSENIQEELIFEQNMKILNLTERQLNDLIKSLTEFYPSFDSITATDSSINGIIEELTAKIAASKDKISSIEVIIANSKNEIAILCASQGIVERNERIIDILTSKKQLIQSSITCFEELRNFIAIDQQAPFFQIQLRIQQAEDLYKNYLGAKKESERKNFLETIITESQASLDQISPKLQHVQEGLAVIDQILFSTEKGQLLREFFQNNDNQIQDIFRRIHTPRELNSVHFFSDDNDDIMITRTNGTTSELNEISSGQRSALALAIFLTLNRKLNSGPNLLLFDDPVAFVDDLNVLSFLDYLREIVTNDNRQLFFSTASKKLAGFFEKKFGFLKSANEFNYISLTR